LEYFTEYFMEYFMGFIPGVWKWGVALVYGNCLGKKLLLAIGFRYPSVRQTHFHGNSANLIIPQRLHQDNQKLSTDPLGSFKIPSMLELWGFHSDQLRCSDRF
jgi:hypothetical protein